MITAIAGSGSFEVAEPAPLTARGELDARLGSWAVGRWRIEEHLGSGGMSAVYGAVHRSSGKRAAVKVLHARLAAIPDAVRRFLVEGSVASRVDHPGAVVVFDEGLLDDGSPCIVMERLDGGGLDRLLDGREPLPLVDAIVILDRLLDVLASAHLAGITHRDVKPDNVFVTTHGTVKLLDFGIARDDEAVSATQAGQIMGTPAYMPPEQAEGRWSEVDRRADVFSVGAVAIALLAGEPPRICGTPNLTLLAATSVPLRGVRERRLEVPPAIAGVVDRAIAWSKGDRFASASEMREALRAAWYATFGTTLEGYERRLVAIGKCLDAPLRTSGVQRTERSTAPSPTIVDRTATMPALRLAPPPARVERPPVRSGESPALAARRALLVAAAAITIVIAMLLGIGLARLLQT
ncbi:MAG: serine/threonine protein kinase [Deltaproteobacteria bacterium]|nr:serine/threonine protein kinase [Deltaproteobacteria bacterium]